MSALIIAGLVLVATLKRVELKSILPALVGGLLMTIMGAPFETVISTLIGAIGLTALYSAHASIRDMRQRMNEIEAK
ncbi:hypothetical protein ACI2KR_27030 [Pseudomonas luteola]